MAPEVLFLMQALSYIPTIAAAASSAEAAVEAIKGHVDATMAVIRAAQAENRPISAAEWASQAQVIIALDKRLDS